MNYFIHQKKSNVIAVYALNDNNILVRISAEGYSYPILEQVNWKKLDACSEEDFNKIKETFDCFLIGKKELDKTKNRVPFTAKSAFHVIVGGEIIVSGHSRKCREDLATFLADNKGKDFRVFDAKGVTLALLNGEITEVASYILYDL